MGHTSLSLTQDRPAEHPYPSRALDPWGGGCLLTLPKGPENSKDFNSGTEESAGNF